MKQLTQLFCIKKFNRNSFRILIPLIVISFLFSCGEEGDEGKVFLRIVESEDCPLVSYTDDNSGLPDNFNLSQFYECKKGTYNYEYVTDCGQKWKGTYRLDSDPGGDADLLEDGEDGETRKYTLKCWSASLATLTVTVGKKQIEWIQFPDTVIQFGNGNTLTLTRAMLPLDGRKETWSGNKLAN